MLRYEVPKNIHSHWLISDACIWSQLISNNQIDKWMIFINVYHHHKINKIFRNKMYQQNTSLLPGNYSTFFQATRGSENQNWWYIELYENYPCKNKERLIIENKK